MKKIIILIGIVSLLLISGCVKLDTCHEWQFKACMQGCAFYEDTLMEKGYTLLYFDYCANDCNEMFKESYQE